MKLRDVEELTRARAEALAKIWPGLTIRVEAPTDRLGDCAGLPTFKAAVPGLADMTFAPDDTEPEGVVWDVRGTFKGEPFECNFCVKRGGPPMDQCETVLKVLPDYFKEDEE